MTLDKQQTTEIEIDTKRIIKQIVTTIIACEILLVILDVTVNFNKGIEIGSVRRFFNLAREDGFGTWFASTQLLAVSLSLGLIAIQSRVQSANAARGWSLTALFFAFLAADEGAKIHERIGTVAEKLADASPKAWAASSVSDFPTYAWHLTIGPVFVVCGLFILRFLWRELGDKTSRILFLSALTAYGVAMGFDFVEGLPGGFDFLAGPLPWHVDEARHYTKVAEEFLEMIGTTLFLACFLRRGLTLSSGLSLSFR